MQLLNPQNSSSKRITITRVTVERGAEQPRHKHDFSEQIWICTRGCATLLLADRNESLFAEGDVARFADGDIHGVRNDGESVFEYISVTSPPIDFGYAYAERG